MANVHIRTFDKEKKSIQCVFHVPVPATGTNVAGVQWQEAVKNWLESKTAITSVIPEVETAELLQLQNGQLIEVQETVRFSSVNLDNAARSAEITAAYNAAVARIQSELQVELAFFGHTIG